MSGNADNLLTNPGFETGATTGWMVRSNGPNGVYGANLLFAGTTTTLVHSGNFAFDVAPPPGGGTVEVFLGQHITVLSAGSYDVSFYVGSNAASSQVTAYIQEPGANNPFVVDLPHFGMWEKVSATVSLPAGQQAVSVTVTGDEPFAVDDFSVIQHT
jgi:hypothetical protein